MANTFAKRNYKGEIGFDYMQKNGWNIIFDYLNYADSSDNNYSHYAYTHHPTDDIKVHLDDEWFLIVEDWDFIKSFNQFLNENYKTEIESELGPGKTYESLTSRKYHEDGDFSDWIEYLTGEMWGFGDEYMVCSECEKAFRYQDSIQTRPHYITYGAIYCGDCVRNEEHVRDSYLKTLINNPENANRILDLESLGFCRINDYPYENGWYGQMDSPAEIFEKAQSEDPKAEFVFEIVEDYNPFATRFNLFKRSA